MVVICVCRDVDDPEYKPAPALLKDDMEVRPQRRGAEQSQHSMCILCPCRDETIQVVLSVIVSSSVSSV